MLQKPWSFKELQKTSVSWTPRTDTPGRRPLWGYTQKMGGLPSPVQPRRWVDSPSPVQPQRQVDSPVQPRRWADSPSPVWPRRWVTFEGASSDASPEMTLKSVDWSWPVEGDDSPTIWWLGWDLRNSGLDTALRRGWLSSTIQWFRQNSGLVTTCQRRPQRPASIGPTCMGIPVQDRITWQWRGGTRLIFDTQTILSWPPGMGQMACLSGGDSDLMARVSSSPPKRRCLSVCKEDTGILPHAQKVLLHHQWEEWLWCHPPCIAWDVMTICPHWTQGSVPKIIC